MPRYLLEGRVTTAAATADVDLDQVIERNLMASVTWIHSFVADGRTYALYEGPHPEAVRRMASATGLEVTRVSEVQLLDPYAHQPALHDITTDDKEPPMALFMDVHTLGDSVAAEDVAEAHKQDLATQGQYGVEYKKYWVDEAAGKIFCLAEGPDAETVSRVHAEAHGLVADEVYQVGEYT